MKMKLVEQYNKILELKKEIDPRLYGLDFYKIKELILWLTNSEEFQKLKGKDSQLIVLDFFIIIWLQEKKYIDAFEMQGDIFFGISSLKDIEEKYLIAKFSILRLENDVPYEYCESAVEDLIQSQFSAWALYSIIMRETEQRESNILKLATILKDKNEMIRAIGLLQKGTERYPKNNDMLLELADCWLAVEQWEKAYNCLCQIIEPGEDIQEMIAELEKVLKHEGIQ